MLAAWLECTGNGAERCAEVFDARDKPVFVNPPCNVVSIKVPLVPQNDKAI